MRLNDFGKVLFIDDDYETISEATTSFLKQGIEVQYWNGSDKPPVSIYNVRIIVTDLDLSNTDMKKALGDNFFIPVVDALSKIPGPFVTIIVAREFERSDVQALKRVYKQRVGVPFPGFIAKKGLTKARLQPARLDKLINSVLEKNEILSLLLVWEVLFDKAKDMALTEITANNVEMSIRALVKLLCKNCHENKGAARELVNEMMRLVSRRIIEIENFGELVEIITKINATLLKTKTQFLTREDRLLYGKLIFFVPAKDEEFMTGDVFETQERFTYGVILTPKCDIMQSKTEKMLVCYGFPLKKAYFRNKEYPPHKNDPAIARLHKEQHKMNEIAKSLEKRYLKETLPEALPVLWNFSEKEPGICLDFNNVQSVDKSKIKTWNRIARIDSPYIEEILQKYGSIVSRIGTLEINRSSSQLQGVLKKIEAPNKSKKPKQANVKLTRLEPRELKAESASTDNFADNDKLGAEKKD